LSRTPNLRGGVAAVWAAQTGGLPPIPVWTASVDLAFVQGKGRRQSFTEGKAAKLFTDTGAFGVMEVLGKENLPDNRLPLHPSPSVTSRVGRASILRERDGGGGVELGAHPCGLVFHEMRTAQTHIPLHSRAQPASRPLGPCIMGCHAVSLARVDHAPLCATALNHVALTPPPLPPTRSRR
jgi:hypothetical protein